MEFKDTDYWKAIILYGLNAATYKIALGKTLVRIAETGASEVTWSQLSKVYLETFKEHIDETKAPQQANPNRTTKMEQICMSLDTNRITKDEAIEKVGSEAFNDVIPRFHNIGVDSEFAKEKFYEIHFGDKLVIKEEMASIVDGDIKREILDELNARWRLLEGAFSIKQENFHLMNDVLKIYIEKGHDRKNITNNIPFLQGYQANKCFYCGEEMGDNIHVDHVLPRRVLNHDEIWNLVLSHDTCNLLKSDKLVGPHFIRKLIKRNENIMGSNHPWKAKIKSALGNTPGQRSTNLEKHYDNVKIATGFDYWNGSKDYSPTNDPFYKSLITKLNNKGIE